MEGFEINGQSRESRVRGPQSPHVVLHYMLLRAGLLGIKVFHQISPFRTMDDIISMSWVNRPM